MMARQEREDGAVLPGSEEVSHNSALMGMWAHRSDLSGRGISRGEAVTSSTDRERRTRETRDREKQGEEAWANDLTDCPQSEKRRPSLMGLHFQWSL